MKLSDNIFTSLSKNINVYIALDSFRFEIDDKTITLKTYIYVKNENDELSIVSVGNEPEDKTNTERIDLFTGKSNINKYDVLVAFLKSAVAQLVNKRAMIRPTINCYGSKQLNKILNGYEEGVLTRAFEEVGAMLVNIK